MSIVVDQFSAPSGIAITIRYPQRTDARRLLAYINALVAEKAMIGKTTQATMLEERAYLRSLLARLRAKECIHLVAEADRTIIAAAVSSRNAQDTGKHLAEIHLGVLKRYRRLGIARRMLQLALSLSRTHLHAEIACLSVFASNRPALRLYRSFGFRTYGRLPRGAKFHGRPIDTVMMYKVLR